MNLSPDPYKVFLQAENPSINRLVYKLCTVLAKNHSQLTFTCLESAVETLENDVNNVQS